MKIAIAILTWNRLPALDQIVSGLNKHCSSHEIAAFEDAGVKDSTVASILQLVDCSERSIEYRYADKPELKSALAIVGEPESSGCRQYFLGTTNLGVAGNSNRALRWFMDETDRDYLCLCNDDLVIKGDFADFYARVEAQTGVGLLCFCGFTSEAYAWDHIVHGDYTFKKLGRMTGAMMCISRKLVERIGYFDLKFGKFGEEHVDYTNRAKLAGFQQLDGVDYECLDVSHNLLEHLEIPSTVTGQERQQANTAAKQGVSAIDYVRDGLYRQFALEPDCSIAGADGAGFKLSSLTGYYHVGQKQVLA